MTRSTPRYGMRSVHSSSPHDLATEPFHGESCHIPRLWIQVVEHPQHDYRVETFITERQESRIAANDGAIRTVTNLTRRFVEANPADPAENRGAETADAAANIQDRLDAFGDKSIRHRPMHVLLPTRQE